MRIWDGSGPPRCAHFLRVRTQGNSGHGLPWPWVCRSASCSKLEPQPLCSSKPPGCQQESVEAVVVVGWARLMGG